MLIKYTSHHDGFFKMFYYSIPPQKTVKPFSGLHRNKLFVAKTSILELSSLQRCAFCRTGQNGLLKSAPQIRQESTEAGFNCGTQFNLRLEFKPERTGRRLAFIHGVVVFSVKLKQMSNKKITSLVIFCFRVFLLLCYCIVNNLSHTCRSNISL